jgi:two-component system, NarL family, sensor kinase
MSPLDLLSKRTPDLLTRIISVACSDRELPRLADELASLVVRSAIGLTFCDVYVLDEEGRTLESGERASVALGEGTVGWVAAHGRPRRHDDLRGATLPVRVPDGGTIAVIDVRGGEPCRRQDLELAEALAALFAPVLWSCRQLRTAREREYSAERFADRAVQVQEAERARLAGEIHDGLAQRLASLGFHLSAAARLLPQHHEEAHEQIVLARELCELAGAETRAAIGGLRPPVLDDLGLSAALATLAREAGTRRKFLDVTVTVSGELEAPLPDHLQTALYRIAQEAVGNCLRHAAADCLDIVLEHEHDRVVLTVIDDGVGFSIGDVFAPGRRPDSYGLRGMLERAELLGGRTTVTSRPDQGTAVRAVLPLRPIAASPRDPPEGHRDHW